MRERPAFAYVVSVQRANVLLNLLDVHRGHLAGHRHGVTEVTEIGSLVGVDAGSRLIVLRVTSLAFSEPREAHRGGMGSTSRDLEPLRNLEAVPIGYIQVERGDRTFVVDGLVSPALGAEAVPLSDDEYRAILLGKTVSEPSVQLGQAPRGTMSLRVPVQELLSRHVAVLGSTGQGKSCFVSAVLQQLAHLPDAKIVVFDVNGEYEDALRPHLDDADLKVTRIGGSEPDYRIPYYALGRSGLARLLLPSERTQRPALNFALDALPYVEWDSSAMGVRLAGEDGVVLFDDCRPSGASAAERAVARLRSRDVQAASEWPSMSALSALIAESHSIKPGRNGVERNSFDYGHVAPLVTRIRRLAEDGQFRAVVDVDGGAPAVGGVLSWEREGAAVVDTMFDPGGSAWRVHIVNLQALAHDLMPMTLGAVLELLAHQLFSRGPSPQGAQLLVLEEAHHYLRQVPDGEDGSKHSLAYERLAKEGRKFGLSLMLSTQRPSELSPTVLAQCGTWVVFRLTSELDLKSVIAASEWADRNEVSRIAGLPRQQAVVFGSALPLPTRIVVREASPRPRSHDPDFTAWAGPARRVGL